VVNRFLGVCVIKIYFSHRIDTNNVGDYWSCPILYYQQYLPNYFEAEKFEIKKVKEKQLTNTSPLIIGGGGLIGEPKFDKILRNVAENHSSKLKVLWGVGDNETSKEKKDFLEYIFKYDIVGIRDYLKGYEDYWVPCVSCKSDLFDKYKGITPRNEIVYYQHLYRPLPQEIIKQRPGPMMTNNGFDFESVIAFLSQGEYVITNSYHGAYWAMLLGKKVIASSWSTKFLNMKHKPVLANPKDWFNLLPNARSFDILDEYRNKNDKFFQKIINHHNMRR